MIVISGMPGEENRADGQDLLDLGAFAYFAKPFKLEEIEAAVDRAVAQHQKLTLEHEASNAEQEKDENAESQVDAPA